MGIHLDLNLTWNHHLKAIKNKASSVVRNVRNLLPSNIKHTIYNSLFRSFVEYGIAAWGRNRSPEMKKLWLLQKRAVRLIDNAKTASHSDPIFFK